jgi:hypothetical protein
MSAHPDPHAELGVRPGASPEEIHRAFRRRLREHHPDTRPQGGSVDPASDHALQRVLAAYAALQQRHPDDVDLGRTEVPAEARQPDRGVRLPPRSPAPSLSVTPVRWVPDATAPPSQAARQPWSSHPGPMVHLLLRRLLER